MALIFFSNANIIQTGVYTQSYSAKLRVAQLLEISQPCFVGVFKRKTLNCIPF
jgi:hypothetical protein